MTMNGPQLSRPAALPGAPVGPPRVSRMKLDAVVRGKQKKPMRIVLFGVEKIGKSTFAAGAPAPIFLGAEDGTSELDVTRFPEPQSWHDLLDAVQTLTEDAHEYKTLVLDTLDWAEPFCWRYVCEKGDEKGKKHKRIEDFGWGKGYTRALDEWRILLRRLDVLREKRGMHIILLAHAHIKPFNNPAGDDYDRYELKVHQKAAGLVKEWSDVVLFTHYDTTTAKKGDGPNPKSRGMSNGSRLIYTTRTPAWDAGNRYGLPKTIPLSWDEYADAVANGAPEGLETVRAKVDALLFRVAPEARAKAEKWLASGTNAKDALKLSLLADKLRGVEIITETSNEESKEETSQQ